MFSKLKVFDVYSKTIEEFRVKTFFGGAISIISIAIITILSLSEFLYYLEIQRVDSLVVDQSSVQRIPIYLNISFPQISCDALTIDVMDVSGEHQKEVEHLFYKQRLDLETGREIATPEKGEQLGDSEKEKEIADKVNKWKEDRETLGNDYCGSCYTGVKDRCCNTCEDVKEEYKKLGWAFRLDQKIEQCFEEIQERKALYAMREGCRINGEFWVKKVAGNFHFAPGRSMHTLSRHIHEYAKFEIANFNTSHTIHHLHFGQKYPGLKSPLEDTKKVCQKTTGLFQYFIKVVPTFYEYRSGKVLETNQFAVTEHYRERNEGSHVVPGVYFIYDLSPIMVVIREERKSFFRFITSLCAILGGVLVVSQMLDGLVFFFQKKNEREKSIM